MEELQVIDDPAAAGDLLDPYRARILALLDEPGSSTSVARALGEPRQKVNYHLRALEEHGLVRLVEERPRRGAVERVVRATARSRLIDPGAIAGPPPDPERTDRLSSRYLLAVAARLVREVAALTRGSDRAGRPLATLTIDTEIRFASAADRATFAAELAEAVGDLAARHHDETAPGGRRHRLVVAAHPLPAQPNEPEESP